jgi:hypothetical protein
LGRLVGERSRCVWTLHSGVGVGAWLCGKVPTNNLTFCPRLHSQLNVFAWCKCQAPRLHRRMHVVYAAMYQAPHLHNRMPSMYQVPHLHNRMHLVCTKPPVCVAGCTWCALGVRWSTKPPICITGCTWWALTQAPHLHSRMHLVCMCGVPSPPFALQDALRQVHPVSCFVNRGLGAASAHQAPMRIPIERTCKHNVSDSTISTVMHRFSSEHRS